MRGYDIASWVYWGVIVAVLLPAVVMVSLVWLPLILFAWIMKELGDDSFWN